MSEIMTAFEEYCVPVFSDLRYTLENSRQAVQDTADRTIITGVIDFT